MTGDSEMSSVSGPQIARLVHCENTERAQRNHREWYRRNFVPSRTAARQWQINNPERVRINLIADAHDPTAAATAEFTPKQLAQRWAYYGDKCWICRAEEPKPTTLSL